MYLEFMEEISDALQRVKINESTILLGDFNMHIDNNRTVWLDSMVLLM